MHDCVAGGRVCRASSVSTWLRERTSAMSSASSFAVLTGQQSYE